MQTQSVTPGHVVHPLLSLSPLSLSPCLSLSLISSHCLHHAVPRGCSPLNWWISPSGGQCLLHCNKGLYDINALVSQRHCFAFLTVVFNTTLQQRNTWHVGIINSVFFLIGANAEFSLSVKKKHKMLMCELHSLQPQIQTPRVKEAIGWLYLECHFVFGWLDSALTWIGFADEGTGEAHRGAAPPTHTAFPLLKQPYILICNICAGRAFQNGCSLEDDGRVCSNLGLGHLVLQGSAQMLAFTMSLCPLLRYPGRSILGEVWCVFFLSSLRPLYL